MALAALSLACVTGCAAGDKPPMSAPSPSGAVVPGGDPRASPEGVAGTQPDPDATVCADFESVASDFVAGRSTDSEAGARFQLLAQEAQSAALREALSSFTSDFQAGGDPSPRQVHELCASAQTLPDSGGANPSSAAPNASAETTTPPAPSCGDLKHVRAFYQQASSPADVDGQKSYWPRITLINDSSFGLSPQIFGHGAATFDLSPDTAPNVTWQSPVSLIIPGHQTKTFDSDSSGEYGDYSLHVFTPNRITAFTVSLKVVIQASDGSEGASCPVVLRQR